MLPLTGGKFLAILHTMNSTQKLLAEIEAFLSRTGMNAGAFGNLSVGDWGLVKRLRAGKTVTLATADAIRLYMQTHAPPRRRPRGNGPGRREVRAA